MALSNWATLAFDTEGKSSDGEFHANGNSLVIYKNWLYIRSPELWQEKSWNFTNSTIAQIDSGDVYIAGFDIHATRHDPQGSVFVYAKSGYGDTEKRFCGVGCYGFLDNVEWAKRNHPDFYNQEVEPFVKEHSEENINSFSAFGGGKEETWGICGYGKDSVDELVFPFPQPDLDECWVGVEQPTFEAFINWLKTVAPSEYVELVLKNTPQQFNQGNAFFAKALYTGIPAVGIGEKDEIVLNKIIKNMDEQSS